MRANLDSLLDGGCNLCGADATGVVLGKVRWCSSELCREWLETHRIRPWEAEKSCGICRTEGKSVCASIASGEVTS